MKAVFKPIYGAIAFVFLVFGIFAMGMYGGKFSKTPELSGVPNLVVTQFIVGVEAATAVTNYVTETNIVYMRVDVPCYPVSPTNGPILEWQAVLPCSPESFGRNIFSMKYRDAKDGSAWLVTWIGGESQEHYRVIPLGGSK